MSNQVEFFLFMALFTMDWISSRDSGTKPPSLGAHRSQASLLLRQPAKQMNLRCEE